MPYKGVCFSQYSSVLWLRNPGERATRGPVQYSPPPPPSNPKMSKFNVLCSCQYESTHSHGEWRGKRETYLQFCWKLHWAQFKTDRFSFPGMVSQQIRVLNQVQSFLCYLLRNKGIQLPLCSQMTQSIRNNYENILISMQVEIKVI